MYRSHFGSSHFGSRSRAAGGTAGAPPSVSVALFHPWGGVLGGNGAENGLAGLAIARETVTTGQHVGGATRAGGRVFQGMPGRRTPASGPMGCPSG